MLSTTDTSPFLWFTISQRLYDFKSEMLPMLQPCSSTLILRYSTALDFYLCPLFLRELGLFIHAPLFSKRCCPSFSRAEAGCTLLSRNTLRQQYTCCGICMTHKLLCLSSNDMCSILPSFCWEAEADLQWSQVKRYSLCSCSFQIRSMKTVSYRIFIRSCCQPFCW
jgi:hypothetical protein